MENEPFKPGVELTFKSVAGVRAKLVKALQTNAAKSFCLDLSAVQHCDSAGLALLIDAKKLCQQHKQYFEVVGLSAQTLALAEFCGVKSIVSTEL